MKFRELKSKIDWWFWKRKWFRLIFFVLGGFAVITTIIYMLSDPSANREDLSNCFTWSYILYFLLSAKSNYNII